MGLDLANEVVIRWDDPDPKHAPLLKEGGVTVAWAPLNDAFQKACSAIGVETASSDDIQTIGMEAWVAGGDCVLALEPGLREALPRGEEKATAAWRGLGQTARWLRQIDRVRHLEPARLQRYQRTVGCGYRRVNAPAEELA